MHCTSLDLDVDSTVWSIKHFCSYLWGTTFRVCSDHKALESSDKVAENNPRVQLWLEFQFIDTLWRTSNAMPTAKLLYTNIGQRC